MVNFYLRVWDGESMHYLTPEETDDAMIFRSQQHFEGDVERVMLGVATYDQVIYEGDFAKVRRKNQSAGNEIVCLVFFSLGNINLLSGDEIFSLSTVLLSDSLEIEVVGNSYKTPELFKEVL